jgi:hypothetical protein
MPFSKFNANISKLELWIWQAVKYLRQELAKKWYKLSPSTKVYYF